MKLKYSKLTDTQTNDLLGHFVTGTSARTAADLASLNRNTVRLFYHKLREIIAWRVEAELPLEGEISVDEAYFGSDRGSRHGPGSDNKTPLFGILVRGGKFHTRAIREVGPSDMPPIQRKEILPDSVVYMDHWRSDKTVDISELRHRIYRSRLVANERDHINEVANLWNQVKVLLGKYNGIPWKHFPLFLKEAEWRINYGLPDNNPDQQKALLRRWMEMHNQVEPPAPNGIEPPPL